MTADYGLDKMTNTQLLALERQVRAELARLQKSEEDEARLRRAESLSAELGRQWPEFKLEILRALAQGDRRLKTLEASSRAEGSSGPVYLQRLPDSAYAGPPSDTAIDAALRNHGEALKAIGFPDEPEDLVEHILGVKVGIGLLGLFVDAWNVRNCEILGEVLTRLSALENQRTNPSNNRPNRK
jgi:hypothetical protein